MSEQQEVQGHLTITAFFGRKVGLPNYSNVEASVFIQRDVPVGASAETITEATQGAFTLAKCMVLDELGIEYTLDETKNVITEVAQPAAAAPVAVKNTPATRKAAKAAAPAVTSEAEAALEAAFGGMSEDGMEQGSVDEGGAVASITPIHDDVIPLNAKGEPEKWWLINRFKTHPEEFYDNRAKKASGEYKRNAADIKHIKSKTGVWLDKAN